MSSSSFTSSRKTRLWFGTTMKKRIGQRSHSTLISSLWMSSLERIWWSSSWPKKPSSSTSSRSSWSNRSIPFRIQLDFALCRRLRNLFRKSFAYHIRIRGRSRCWITLLTSLLTWSFQLMIRKWAPLLLIQMVHLLRRHRREATLSRFTAQTLVKLSRNLREEIVKPRSKASFSTPTSTSWHAHLQSSPYTSLRSPRQLRSVSRLGNSDSPTETFRRRLKPKTQNQASNSWRCLISIGRVTFV